MSTINIHEYPTDSTLLPAYRIAVMQAALEGKEVEWRNLYFPSWHKAPSPCWDWVAYCYRITPPAIAPGHNPDKLTVEQVGEGYRLLTLEEAEYQQSLCDRSPDDIQRWEHPGWSKAPAGGGTVYHAYRTARPAGYFLPEVAQGHNPANITVDKIPAGWRLFSKEEYEYLQKTKAFNSPYPSVDHTCFWYTNKWSIIGTWGLYEGTGGGTLITDKPTGFYLPKQPETVMEWLLTLPKEYRVLAIRNMQETTKDLRRLGLPSAISSAFVWSGSPEGHEFWASVCTSLAQGSSLPPIPVVSTPKKLVPWTLETMVWPDCVRNKDSHAQIYGVQLADSNGLSLGVRPEGCATYVTTWQRLYDESEYSADNGKTWLPCGTWVDEKS